MRYASCAGREVSRATVAGSAETGNVGRRPVNKRTVQLTSVTESSPSSRTSMRRVGSESHARRHPGRRCGCHIARAFARAACLLDTRPVRAAAVRPSLPTHCVVLVALVGECHASWLSAVLKHGSQDVLDGSSRRAPGSRRSQQVGDRVSHDCRNFAWGIVVLGLSRVACRAAKESHGKSTSDRRPYWKAHARAAQPSRHQPDRSRRLDGCDVSTSPEVRTGRQPHRRHAPVRSIEEAGRSNLFFLRECGRPALQAPRPAGLAADERPGDASPRPGFLQDPRSSGPAKRRQDGQSDRPNVGWPAE